MVRPHQAKPYFKEMPRWPQNSTKLLVRHRIKGLGLAGKRSIKELGQRWKKDFIIGISSITSDVNNWKVVSTRNVT